MKGEIERAVQRRDAGLAELERPDGSNLYGPEEHAEREAAIEAEFKSTMDAIEGEIDKRIARGEEALLMAENADPTDALTTSELERANAKRAFVSDEASTLPLEDLERRLRAVLAQGDRPTMFLYALYAGQRVGNAEGVARKHLDRRYGDGAAAHTSPGDEEGAQEIRAAVSELWTALNPEGAKKIAAAREAVEEAQDLSNHAYLRRRGASNVAQLFLDRKYGAAS